MLNLPSRWVFVYYGNGMTENVANSDTLSDQEAQEFKEYWENARKMKVVRVDLQDNRGRLLKCFTY